MRRAVLTLALAAGLALTLGGIRSGAVRAQQGESSLCFLSDQGPVCVARPALVAWEGAAPAEALMRALVAGPSPEEQARGLRSAIPPGTELAEVVCAHRPREGHLPSACRSLTIRLNVPAEALARLDILQVEEIGEQIRGTLAALAWRDLYIEAFDAQRGAFRPLSDFLGPLPVPRKAPSPAVDDEAALPAAWITGGQPPAYGQGQPQGALSGKTVYVSAGHGWQWTESAWRTQRRTYPLPPYPGPIIEDHNNAEAVNQYLLQYLWNAGAQVFTVRERDLNSFSTIVNNDLPGAGNAYAENGPWTTGGAPGFDPDQPGHTYRYTLTVTGTATAVVTWTATVPSDGRYALYVWYQHGSNRASDAHYRVFHAGGITEVILDQTRHGQTWRYLGTYAFRAAEGARVALDNRSAAAGQAVVADALRVGGGTFDSLAGIQTAAPYAPNKPWWEAAAFYFTQRQGYEPGDYFNDVVARPMYARWEHAGSGEDALYISWHTNGYSGYQEVYRGTESYIHNGETYPVTEGSAALRHAVHTELVHDLRAGWDATWVDRGQKSANLGELRELWDPDPAARMPGTLIEIAFHDHPSDTDALKDPRFEMLAARAIYQGIVRYFETRDGVDLALLPEPPTHLRLINLGAGRVAARWQPSPTDVLGLAGDAASGYRVYTSTDGLGWSNGIPVAGSAYTMSELVPGSLVFVRVTATNAGGESFPSEVLGARAGSPAGVLLVNGFDRIDRHGLIPENDPAEGYNLRMFLERINRYDYAIHHGSVIVYPFDSASNEAVADGLVSLTGYRIVDWIVGEESSADETLSSAERAELAAYLDGEGALFISGAEIAWELDYLGRAPGFYNTYLKADYVADDAQTYRVVPVGGSIFEGLAAFGFDAPGEYDADYPDRIAPLGGSMAALAYQGGTGGTAAVQYANGCRRVVHFGFPFETIRAEERPAVMARVMMFLDECLMTVTPTLRLPLVLSDFAGAPGCTDHIVNGGFEDESGWKIVTTAYPAGYTTALAHTGARSMRVGIPIGEPGGGSLTYSSVSQTLTLPAGQAITLRYWVYPIYQDPDDDDLQYVWLIDGAGKTQLLYLARENLSAWVERTLDLSAFGGQRIQLYFSVHNDGDNTVAVIYLDDVRVEACPP